MYQSPNGTPTTSKIVSRNIDFGDVYTSKWWLVSDNQPNVTIDLETTPQPVPEPATLFLISCGIAGFTGLRKARKK